MWKPKPAQYSVRIKFSSGGRVSTSPMDANDAIEYIQKYNLSENRTGGISKVTLRRVW